MAITRFQDLPSTNTPINSANLNGNFDELGVKVGTSVDSNYRTNIIKSKNLFNLDVFFDNALLNNCTKEKTTTGIKINFTAGVDAFVGYTFASGTISGVSRKSVMEVKPNTTYTLSTSSLFRNSSYICYADSNYNVLNSNYIQIPNQQTFTFTTPANTKYVLFRFGVRDSSISTYTFDNIMLNEGDTALSYEAYISPILNVDGEDIYNVPKVLWTNPSPTSAFTSQNIILSSGDYDYLEVYYWRATTQKFEKSLKVQKGENFLITDFATSNNAYPWFRDRTFTYTDDTHYAVGTCYLQFTNSNTRSEETTGLIPLLITGHKE